ncbi:MAG: hypothetical protein A2Z21_06065 [Candidatus Fraserbacteria bacterium RBG_16_55_9]|uniref:Uncharacterized protein n=1 Tax=Fraserbacteria sp. (strain RBG_16_55_9) TaxID=1817864 RepID=A0A1F5V2D7_FRAXR|nr:MAG: hypothetical protein A2Z21_06065 [Candidatus Fraserbacteria bacterium RBG_16_55_9]
MVNQQAQPVASGVYLYLVAVRGQDGQELRSEMLLGGPRFMFGDYALSPSPPLLRHSHFSFKARYLR